MQRPAMVFLRYAELFRVKGIRAGFLIGFLESDCPFVPALLSGIKVVCEILPWAEQEPASCSEDCRVIKILL